MLQTRPRPRCFGDRRLGADAPPAEPLTDHAEVAAFARALAHPARVAIIERFADGRPKMTKELVAPSGLAPSTMSEHLRILRDVGLLVTRPDGTGVWYCLRPDRLAALAESIHALLPASPAHEREES